MTKSIGYVSDCHSEFNHRDFIIPDGLTALVLAGDIHTTPKGVQEVIEIIRKKSDVPIIYVLGNHEYYGQVFPDTLSLYDLRCRSLKNVYLLEKSSVVIDDIRFLGTTLWSNLSDPMDALAARDLLNDFSMIVNTNLCKLTTEEYTEEHFTCVGWLGEQLEKAHEGPTVVVTHHSPSSITCVPQYRSDKLRHCFYSHLEDLIFETEPAVWVYGHDHTSARHELGGTLLVSNQIGYPVYGRSAKEIKVERILL